MRFPVVNFPGIQGSRLGDEEFADVPAELKKDFLDDRISETRRQYAKVVAVVNGFGGLESRGLKEALGDEYIPFVGMYQMGIPRTIEKLSEKISSGSAEIWYTFSAKDEQEVDKWRKEVAAMNDLLMRHNLSVEPGVSAGTITAGAVAAIGIGALIYFLS